MARRFTKSHVLPMAKCTSGFFTDAASFTTDGILRVCRPNSGWIRMRPQHYSNVRKVTFSCCIAWIENNPARTLDIQLMVGPMSTSPSARLIHVKNIPLATMTKETPGQTTPWDYEPYNLVNPNFQNTMLYSRRGVRDTVTGQPSGVFAGQTTMFHITFDRFSGLDDDFFSDWDAAAASAGDDDYVGYNVYAGVVESTYVAGSTGTLNCYQVGCHVTQAPGPENNTITWVDVSRLNFYTIDLCLNRRTTYSAWPAEHLGRWKYDADDWDGVYQVAQWNQICTGIILPAQQLGFRLDQGEDPSVAVNVVDEQINTNTSGSTQQDVVRSADVKDLLLDGGIYSGDFYVQGSGGNNTGSPQQQLEIVQRNTTKTVFYIAGGRGPSNAAPNRWFNVGQGYFDPLFFEDFEDDFFTRRFFAGTLQHEVAAHLLQYFPKHDAQLDANDDTPATSATSLRVQAGEVNSSGLNDSLNPQSTYQEYPILGNDPLQLAGERKVYGKVTNATVGGTGDCGWLHLGYSHDVPNTEAPELGPLFQLSEFNPEGCAATSAGLGDPGILIITNGSALPQKFNPQAGTVENASLPLPYKDEVPSTTTQDAALSPDNGLNLGTYRYRYTFRNCCTGKESDPNPEDIVVDTTAQAPGAQVTLSFAGVRIPGDAQICEICIYRTTVGGDFPVMAKVGCLDVDSPTGIFVDTVSDNVLDFTNEGLSILNGPMPCTPVVIEFQNRLFALGDIPDLSPDGTVTVVNGSDVVVGSDDVDWSRCVEGKYLHVQGDCRAYEIDTVQPPEIGLSPPLGRLCLVEEYEGDTNTDLNYTICGHPNRLYVSEPFEPEYWPAASYIDVEPGDGDRLMGGISNFSRLVVCKRHKTYVLTFRENPVLEVAALTRISSDIGCVGPRTFAQVEMGSVWLADRGLVLFNGQGVSHIGASDRMNDLFVDPENPRYMRRDANGRVIEAVGVFYPKREQYLCLIPTVQTTRGCNLMVVWDVKLQNVTLYEFCQEFLSMVVAKDADGNERVYMGDTNGFVWILDIGDTDGVGFPNATGTVRGTITAAGVDNVGASYMDDSAASFITGGLPELAGLSGTVGLSGAFTGNELGLAGVCVHYRRLDAERGDPWLVRTVYAATDTRLYITPNWAGEEPAAGEYEYMLGAIDFRAIFKQRNFGTLDMTKRDWSHILSHVPEAVATELRVELLPDLAANDPYDEVILDDDGEPAGARLFDLSFSEGRQTQPTQIQVHSYLQVQMTNFAPDEPVRLLNHVLRMTGRGT